jgi:hypothetical protein
MPGFAPGAPRAAAKHATRRSLAWRARSARVSGEWLQGVPFSIGLGMEKGFRVSPLIL